MNRTDDEWSPMEIDSLKAALEEGLSMEEAAEVLERKVGDVTEKSCELGLTPRDLPPGPSPCRGGSRSN
jgi:hypothetical protein